MHLLKKHTRGEKSGHCKTFWNPSWHPVIQNRKGFHFQNLHDVLFTAFLQWLIFFFLQNFSHPQNSISKKSKFYKVNNHHRLVKDWIWIWLHVVGWCPGDVHRLDIWKWLRSRWVCLQIQCKRKKVQSSVSSEGWIISWNHRQSSASVKSRLVSESPVCLKLLH